MRAIPALAAVLTLVPRLARAVPSPPLPPLPPLPPPSPPPPSPPPESVCAAATDCDNACACGVCLKELNASRCLETAATWKGRATDASFCDHELQPLDLQDACASAGECGTDGTIGNCAYDDGSAAAVYERFQCACASPLPVLPPLPPLPWGPPPSPLPPLPPPEVGGQVSTGLVAAVAALCLLGTCVLIAARLLRSAQAPVAIPETTRTAAGSFRWQLDGMVLVE